MPLPFNPMSFVTPYTAVGASQIGAGANFANVVNAARNTKVQEGYLANTQRRTAFDEEQAGKAEMDKARAQLDAAILSGNSDMADAALNNLRVIAERNGMTIAETRSDAALNTGVTDKLGEQKALTHGSAGKLRPDEVGSEEKPFDLDAYDAAQAPTDGSSDQVNAEADSRIDQALEAEQAREQLKAFTGTYRVPGGSLPAEPAGPVEPGIRTPGGSLPPSVTAEAKQAPLRGYTLIGKDGKPLYTVAPKDVETSQRGRVGSVFSALSEKSTDPQEKQWLAQAQAMAERAVGTMSLEDAVRTGLEFYTGRMRARDALGVVEANKRRPTGGGGVLAFSGKTDDTLNDDVDKVRTMFVNSDQYKNVVQKRLLVDGAVAQLASPNGMSQQEAVSTLRRIQSGLTLNAFETAEFNNAAGAIEGLYNRFNKLFGGGELSPEYKRQLEQVYANISKTLDKHTERLAQEAYDYFVKTRGRRARPEIIQEKGEALKKSLGGGGANNKAKSLLEK